MKLKILSLMISTLAALALPAASEAGSCSSGGGTNLLSGAVTGVRLRSTRVAVGSNIAVSVAFNVRIEGREEARLFCNISGSEATNQLITTKNSTWTGVHEGSVSTRGVTPRSSEEIYNVYCYILNSSGNCGLGGKDSDEKFSFIVEGDSQGDSEPEPEE